MKFFIEIWAKNRTTELWRHTVYDLMEPKWTGRNDLLPTIIIVSKVTLGPLLTRLFFNCYAISYITHCYYNFDCQLYHHNFLKQKFKVILFLQPANMKLSTKKTSAYYSGTNKRKRFYISARKKIFFDHTINIILFIHIYQQHTVSVLW